MDWSREQTVELVKLLEIHPVLWNTRLDCYKNKNLKRRAVDEISSMLKIPAEEVDRRIHNLKVQFSREHCKVLRITRSGHAKEKTYEPKWYGYKPLMFLRNGNMPTILRKPIIKQHQPPCEEPVVVEVENHSWDTSTSNQANGTERDIDGDEPSMDLKPIQMFPESESSRHQEIPNRSSLQHSLQHRTHQSPMKRKEFSKSSKMRKEKRYIRETYGIVKKIIAEDSTEDEFSLFGQYIAQKLRTFQDGYYQSIVKHEINEVIFNNEIKQLTEARQSNSDFTEPSNREDSPNTNQIEIPSTNDYNLRDNNKNASANSRRFSNSLT